MKSFFNEILAEYNIDISNIWIRFMLGYMIICSCIVFYFSLLYPIITHSQDNRISQKQETELMYLVRSIYNKNDSITYFNMFPIIGGDRIFVVRSKDMTITNKLEKSKWKLTEKKEKIYKATKGNYVATFNETTNNVLVVGGINSRWTELWYDIYVTYYIKLDN